MQLAVQMYQFPKKKHILITLKKLMMTKHLKSKGSCVATVAPRQTCGCSGL